MVRGCHRAFVSRVCRAGLICMVALAGAGAVHAADLHLVVFADTLDPEIGTEKDLLTAADWGQFIADSTGLTLRMQTLSGDTFTADAAAEMLTGLSPAADDVVYFIYSGHGANFRQSEWPTFTLMNEDLIDMDDVVAILGAKPQRLLVVLADCCNGYFDATRSVYSLFPSGQAALTTTNMKRLFLEFRGTVFVSSSRPGQYSLGDEESGGLFLSTFMEDFMSLAATVTDLTWEAVLTTTVANVQRAAAEENNPQDAQFAVRTEQVAAETPDPANDDSQDPPSVGRAPSCGGMGIMPLAAAVCLRAMRRRGVTAL